MDWMDWIYLRTLLPLEHLAVLINDYHPAPLIPALVHWAKQPPSGVNLLKVKWNASIENPQIIWKVEKYHYPA